MRTRTATSPVRPARDPEKNSGPAWLVLKVATVVTVAWLIFPTLIVVPISFSGSRSYQFPPKTWSLRWYEDVLSSPLWLESAWSSLWLALVVALLSAAIGTIAAIGLRAKLPGKLTISGLILSPLVVPVVLIGIGTYLLFLQWGLVSHPLGFILAHTVLGIPYVIVAATASLSGVDRDIERAAASLGARPLTVFFAITLRMILPGVLAGALFAFVASFDELIVSLFLVGPSFRTLPVALFSAVSEQSNPGVAAVSVLVLLFTTLVMLVTLYAQKKATR